MASEIRVDKINSLSGVGTVTLSPTGVDISGITTVQTLKVGTGVTASEDGDIFFTGVCTATTFAGAHSGSGANLTSLPAGNLTGALPAISGANLTGIAATDNVRTGILDVAGVSTFRNTMNVGAAVTISESGIEASGIGITVANINGSQIGGRRNLIINGAMNIAQRSTSGTTSGFASVDRFETTYSGTDEAPTQSQHTLSSSDDPYAEGLRYSYHVTNGNQTSGAGSGDYIRLRYKMEAQDMAQSGWNYTSSSSFVTLSYWIKASVSQTYYTQMRTNDGTDQHYVFEQALTANTWKKVVHSIPGDSDLQFDLNNEEGFYIAWYPFRGTDNTGSVTLNQWANWNSSAIVPDMTSTWYTTNDSTIEITGVQLEVGSQATAFEHHSFGEELSLCQRYYLNFLNYDGQGTNPESNLAFAVGTWYNSTYIFCPVRFPVPMRTAPTMESSSGTNDYYALYGAHVDFYNENGLLQASNMGARIYPIVGTATQGSSGVCTVLHVETAATAQLRFTAEL